MLELIKKLSTLEIKQFRQFLSSEFFNNSCVLRELLEMILAESDKPGVEKIIYKELASKKISNKYYTEPEIRNYVSKLNKKIMDFLAVKNVLNDPFIKDEIIMTVLTGRNVEKLFSNVLIGYKKNIHDNGMERSAFRKEYTAHSKNFDYLTIHFPVLRKYEAEEKLQLVESCLDALRSEMFTSIVADNITYIINKIEFENEGYDVSGIDRELINFMHKKYFRNKKTSLPALYKLLFDCFSDFDQIKAYKKYKNHFFKIASSLNYKETTYHYQKLFTYCILRRRKSLEDNQYFKAEAFALERFFLKNFMYKYTEPRTIATNFVINLTRNCTTEKDLNWIKSFLNEHQEDIYSPDLENLLLLIEIFSHSVRKDFDEAFILLAKINPTSISFKYVLRTLKLQLLYEIREEQNVIDDVNSFREFIRADRFLNLSIKKRAINFARFLERLIKYSVNHQKLSDSYLLLIHEKGIFFKDWLIEKYLEKLH